MSITPIVKAGDALVTVHPTVACLLAKNEDLLAPTWWPANLPFGVITPYLFWILSSPQGKPLLSSAC